MARTKATQRLRPGMGPETSIRPSTNVPPLPEEILQVVFQQLSCARLDLLHNEEALFRTTLASACLTNKQILRLARPILYTALHFNWKQNVVEASQILVRSPHLFSHVRLLRIDCWQCAAETEAVRPRHRPLARCFRQVYEDLLGSSVLAMYPAIDSAFLDAVMDGSEDAHLAFLIMQCKELQTLSLSIPLGFDRSIVSATLSNASTMSLEGPSLVKLHPLAHLRSFHAQHWDTENTYSFGHVSTTLQLKSLKEYRGEAVQLTGDTVTTNSIRQIYSLRLATLQDSLVDAEGLHSFLLRCSSLSSLSIQWSGVLRGSCQVDFRQIGSVLRQHGRGLQHLGLAFGNDENVENHEVATPIGSLKALCSLKTLQIPAFALYGDQSDNAEILVRPGRLQLLELLPDSLQRLHVSMHDYPAFRDDKEALLRSTMSRSQSLAALSVAGEMLVRRSDQTQLWTKWQAVLVKRQNGFIEMEQKLPSLHSM